MENLKLLLYEESLCKAPNHIGAAVFIKRYQKGEMPVNFNTAFAPAGNFNFVNSVHSGSYDGKNNNFLAKKHSLGSSGMNYDRNKRTSFGSNYSLPNINFEVQQNQNDLKIEEKRSSETSKTLLSQLNEKYNINKSESNETKVAPEGLKLSSSRETLDLNEEATNTDKSAPRSETGQKQSFLNQIESKKGSFNNANIDSIATSSYNKINIFNSRDQRVSGSSNSITFIKNKPIEEIKDKERRIFNLNNTTNKQIQTVNSTLDKLNQQKSIINNETKIEE